MMGPISPPMARRNLPWIERHGPGWRAWWTIAGIRRRGPVRGTQQEAYQDAVQARRRTSPGYRRLSLGQAVQLLRDDLRARERSPGTLAWYECQIRVILRFWRAHSDLDGLDARELQAWIAVRRHQVSDVTVGHTLRCMRRLFRVAVAAGWGGSSPIPQLLVPTARSEPIRPIPWNELEQLLSKVRAHSQADADCLELLARTGLRRAEAARLRAPDIDLETGVIRVAGKTGPRVVPIAAALQPVAERLARRDPCFCSADWISRVAARWARRLGERRLRPHMLRHSLATELVRKGVPLPTVARLLGHAPGSLAVTQRYYGPAEPELRAAVDRLS